MISIYSSNDFRPISPVQAAGLGPATSAELADALPKRLQEAQPETREDYPVLFCSLSNKIIPRWSFFCRLMSPISSIRFR